jgi:hypothetical protein
MEKIKIEELISHIQKIEELSEEEKNYFIKQLQDGKNPEEVLDEIEDKLQKKIDNIFDSEGITVDENDPEYQAKYKEMNDEIAVAEAEFNQEMTSIEKEADQLQSDTSRELDEEKLEEVRSKLATEE